MAITTQNGLIAAMATGKTVNFYKGLSTAAAGFVTSLFRIAGLPAAAPAVAASPGTALSRTSTGAMFIPPASLTSYITNYEGVSGSTGTMVLADRLVEVGGLSGIVTTAQTVNSVALPARASAADDVELWLEVFTLAGTTTSSVTASYTNNLGVAGRTATLVGGIPATGTPVGRSYQMALQAGDTGVQSVQTVTIGASTGVAGNLGIVLRRTMLFGPIVANNIGFFMGYAETDLQRLADEACVELLYIATTTATGTIQGNFGVAQG